jgi:hypothetical protein
MTLINLRETLEMLMVMGCLTYGAWRLHKWIVGDDPW